MNRHPLLEVFLDRRIVAVIRTMNPNEVPSMIEAIIDGGISLIEITLTTPGGLDLIAQFANDPRIVIGAGSVLDATSARRAIASGARFLASPIFDTSVIDAARSFVDRAPPLLMPGAFTPTEIHCAWSYGADIVKLFPMPPNGLEYIRSIRGPLPDVRLAPSGGVNPTTAASYIQAGAALLNVGGWLTNDADGTLLQGEIIRERAAALVASIVDVRVGPITE
jgi:2-dehydro-3-deoxyphosphogluconate aldolase/(4S)-4-hydroxy-2-oxoglutarate aldolase